MGQLVQQSQTNIKRILCNCIVYKSVCTLPINYNKSSFVLFFTLFVVVFDRFLCFTVLFCFPFYSISGSDTNSELICTQTNRETLGTRRRRRWRLFLWKSIWNFRWFFILFLHLSFSFSFSLFCIAVASRRFQKIFSVQWIAVFIHSIFHFVLICLLRSLGICIYLRKFFLSLFELWYICYIFENKIYCNNSFVE